MTQPLHSANAALGLLATLALGFALFHQLGAPLFWADEAETAMFGERVLEYGYPKVHGDRNVVYQFGPNIALGVKEGPDAYIGTTWGQFYFAALGLAWAESAPTFAARTARARLPFALAGALGLGFWLAALLPVFRGDRARAWRFAAAFLLLSALSVSLILHLREARYYALVVCLAGILCREHLRYAVYRVSSYARWLNATVVLLFALFHVFFQAYFAITVLLGAERVWALWRRRTTWLDLLPVAAAGALLAPFMAWFEIFNNAAEFSRGFEFGLTDYVANLRGIGAHLLRHEFLAPALVARALAWWLRAGSREGRKIAGGLLLFSAGFVVAGCVNPLALERYFIVVSPCLLGSFLLDAFALVDAARRRPGAPSWAGSAAAIAIAAIALGLRLPGLPAVADRVAEWVEPALGPLDYAIPFLAERYPQPEALVIATNYEEYAFMYYLRSHVIVGLSLNNLRRDHALAPDVVIPRRRWPRSMQELGPYLREGDWDEVRLPVADVHHNNVPALSASRFIPAPHRFVTPESDDPDEQLVLYLRRSSANTTGTSSRP
jgi:hypothetical protein